jgi:hypothetical protein
MTFELTDKNELHVEVEELRDLDPQPDETDDVRGGQGPQDFRSMGSACAK